MPPSLELTTTGRRSRTPRSTTLYYGRDGDRYLVVASNAGSPSHPAWYLNLTDNPDVTVQIAAELFAVRARPADPPNEPDYGP